MRDEAMKTLGYSLSALDNRTHMFYYDELPDHKKCSACGYRLNFFSYNPDYELKRCRADYSATYDGYFIVTKLFKDFCLKQKYKGLVFGEFSKDKSHYNFGVRRVVKFDSRRRDTTFEWLCKACGNYESVVGATPGYLH